MPACCVPFCDTGRAKSAQLASNQDSEIRKKSYFSLPKDERLREQWMERLVSIRESSGTYSPVICELHFKESDVIKYFVKTLPDGQIQKIERRRYKLKPQALPLPLSNAENTQCTKKKTNKECGSQQDINIESEQRSFPVKREALGDVNALQNANVLVHNVVITTNGNQIDAPVLVDIPIKCESSGTEVFSRISSNPETDIASQSNIYVNEEEIQSECSAKSEPYDELFEPYEPSDPFKLSEPFQQSVPVKSNILDDLKTKCLSLPDDWMSSRTQPDGSVKLIYVHPFRDIVYLSCIINTDMSVQAVTMNKNVKRVCDVTLESAQDLQKFLLQLQKSKCCEGVGIDNMFSNSCEGFIRYMEENSNILRRAERCKPCLRQRGSILKKRRLAAKSLKNLDSNKKKLKFLVRRVKVLEDMVDSFNSLLE